MSHWNNTWNYRKVTKHTCRYSAGILPYTYNQQGQCLFLLGKDYEGDWSDFGGKCEFKDSNEPENTACREFYEETLGAVIDITDCREKIIHGKPIKIISKTLNGSPYYMFLLYVDFSNYSETFNKTSNFLKYQFQGNHNINKIIEKTSIRWVTIDTLLNCIDNTQEACPLSLRGVFKKTIENCKEQIICLNKI